MSTPGSTLPRFGSPTTRTGPADKAVKLMEVIGEMNDLVGLDNVKRQLDQLIAFAEVTKVKMARNLPVGPLSLHMVFMGPPGTGKTEVARKVGKMLHAIDRLKRGHVVEVDRSQLVASYLGQTAKLVDDKINEAKDGVLFIDEAYTLAGIKRNSPTSTPDQYGQEAIDTLLKRMEDNRDRLVVIVAGYTEEMRRFLQTNVGLESRFAIRIQFENYSEDELNKIFMGIVAKNQMTLTPGAERVLRQEIRRLSAGRDETFGNAREMRKLFERVCQAQASRLGNLHDLNQFSDEVLLTIEEDDVMLATD